MTSRPADNVSRPGTGISKLVSVFCQDSSGGEAMKSPRWELAGDFIAKVVEYRKQVMDTRVSAFQTEMAEWFGLVIVNRGNTPFSNSGIHLFHTITDKNNGELYWFLSGRHSERDCIGFVP
ncbi:hypothetical protein J6590_005182 [Homalodisca vitripennis]|nr:hypothetical protein J6590_005182 [Homalodisca vitripennis]